MDVSALAPRVRSILQGSDLATVSAKKVRRQLEAELNMSLDASKVQIDKIIMDQFHQIHNETQTRQQQLQQQQQQYAQQHQAQMSMYGVSPQMAGLHVPQGGYPNIIHHPNAAAAVAGMGHGAPGMIPGGVGASGSLSPDAAPRKRGRPRKPENEKKQHRKKREVDPNKPKRQTGLSKPMKLSADLSAFLGQKYCARTDVVKNLWKYIKENNMQDPSDKRYILCDDKLKKLFDTDRLYMYTMNKLLNQHLVKPTPEENAEAIVLLGLPPTHPAAADSAGIIHGVTAGGDASAASNNNDDAAAKSESSPGSDAGASAVSESHTAGSDDAKHDTSGAADADDTQQPPAGSDGSASAAPSAAQQPAPAATGGSPQMTLPPQPSSSGVNGSSQ